jgi:hypothetical protein
MSPTKFARLCIALFLLCGTTLAQQPKLTWYPFDTTFISARYANSAIGEVPAKASQAAKSVHAEICGGDDAELHIGIKLADVGLAANQMPLTGPVVAGDSGWGIVAELPNGKLADGPAKFAKLAGKPITFTGYFRVWDEGHAKGAVHPSNPHHVFEVHPAWAFRGAGVSFSRVDLVASMGKYRGFGAKKFKELLSAVSAEKWPLAYQDEGKLFVGLAKDQNFYQLPVEVKAKKSVSGGHEWTLDVFTDKAISKLFYSGLTAVTADGSPIDDSLKIGQKSFLLGFFSVNLKKALDASEGAGSEAKAVPVKEALEFFVFGVARNSAVESCSKH